MSFGFLFCFRDLKPENILLDDKGEHMSWYLSIVNNLSIGDGSILVVLWHHANKASRIGFALADIAYNKEVWNKNNRHTSCL